MEQKYTIEELIKTFEKHGEEVKNHANYKEGQFCITRALKSMCEAIKEIQDRHRLEDLE